MRLRGLCAVGLVAAVTTAGSLGATAGAASRRGVNAATPKIDRDATIRIPVPVAVLQLDPHKLNSPLEGVATYPIYDRLLQVDNDLELKPMLAKSWAYSTSRDTLTLKLRDDVKFHDGSPVDAAAVKASLNRGLTLPGSSVKASLQAITSIDTPDATTVVLGLAPNVGAGLARTLATHAGDVINPAAIAAGTNLGLAPGPNAGSGPYQLVEFVPNQRWVLQRAPGKFWDPTRGLAKRLELTTLPDAQRVTGVQTGLYDFTFVASGGPAADARAFAAASNGKYKVRNVKTNTTWALILNPARTDVNLRRALQAGIDREAIVKALLPGVCSPSATVLPKGADGYSSDNAAKFANKPDLLKAKQLLADARNKNVSVLYVSGHPFLDPLSQILQQVLKDAGAASVALEGLPTTGLLNARIAAAPDYDIETNATFAAVDATTVLSQTLVSGPKAYPAEKLAELTGQMAQLDDPATTEAQRQKLIAGIEATVLDQATVIPICTIDYVFLHDKRILHVGDVPWKWFALFDPSVLAVAR